MNKLLKIVFVTGLFSISQLAYAVDITDSYTTGDTLTATKMNNIKSGVNSKQNRVTGTCTPPLVIEAINADGTVVCAPATGDGIVSVAGVGFHMIVEQNGCVYDSGALTLYFSSGNNCYAAAMVQFPQNARINNFVCFIRDEDNAVYISLYLYRLNLTDGTTTPVFSIPYSNDATGIIQLVRDDTVNNLYSNIVDNELYSYIIQAGFNGTIVPGLTRVVSCQAKYSAS
jgi:hypothetical protein